VKSSLHRSRQRNALGAAVRKYKEANPRTEFVFRFIEHESIVRVWRVQPDYLK